MAKRGRPFKDYGDPCARCKAELTPENGIPKTNGKPGVKPYCRTCQTVIYREKVARLPNDYYRKKYARRKARDPQHHNDKVRRYNAKIRDQFLTAYGRKCACCGETTLEFLGLDHINGITDADRDKRGKRKTGILALLVAKSEGWPDRFQILCHNCNLAKGFYGQCPHKTNKS